MSPRAAAGFQPARAPVPDSLSASGEAEVLDKKGSQIIAGEHDAPEENEKGKFVYSERRAKRAKELLNVVDLPKHTESPFDVSA